MTTANDVYSTADNFIKYFNIDPGKYNEETFKNEFVRTPDTIWLFSSIVAMITISAGLMLFGSDDSLKYIGTVMFFAMFALYSFQMGCLLYFRQVYRNLEKEEANRIIEIRAMFASFEKDQ